MDMKRLLILACFALNIVHTAWSVEISGSAAPVYAGKKIFLYRVDDVITNRSVLLDSSVVSNNGEFQLQGGLHSTHQLRLNCNLVNFYIFAEPVASYQLYLPELPEGDFRTIGNRSSSAVVFYELKDDDINRFTLEFNTRFDSLLNQIIDLAFSRAYFDSLDHFYRRETRMATATRNSFFAQYVHYSIADQYLNSNMSERHFFDRFLSERVYNVRNPAFTRVFTTFFKGLVEKLDRFSRNDGLNRLLTENRPQLTFYEESLKKLDFLKDDQLRDIAGPWGLYEVILNDPEKKEGAGWLLREYASGKAGKTAQRLASNIIYENLRFEKGSAVMDLAVETMAGKQAMLSNYLDHPTLLVYWSSWSQRSLEELSLLQTIRQSWNDRVQIILLSVQDDVKKARETVELFPKINGTWLFTGQDPLVLEKHRVVAIPKISLINARGEYFREWMSLPSENLDEQLRKYAGI